MIFSEGAKEYQGKTNEWTISINKITPTKTRKPKETKTDGMSLPSSMSSKFIQKLLLKSEHIVLIYSSSWFPLFLMVLVLLSSLHHKRFLGLAVHLQLCYNEEGPMSIISIISNLYFLRYDMLMFLFEMCLYCLVTKSDKWNNLTQNPK